MYPPTWKRWTILAFGLLENLVFSGSILGWAPLNYMLKEEGIFSDSCITSDSSNLMTTHSPPFNSSIWTASTSPSPLRAEDTLVNNFINYSVIPELPSLPESNLIMNRTTKQLDLNTIGCPAQDRLLNLAYTLGIFFNGFTAFIWGFLLDKWGLRIVRLIINLFLFTGSLLLCFTAKESSYLVFPAIIFLCLGGVPIRIANMQFANLFPKNRSTVITFYSGAFSASAVLFVFLKSAYDAGISFATASSSLVLLSLIMVPVTFILLPKDKVREPSESEPNSGSDSDSVEQIIKSKKYAKSNLSLIGSDITLEGYKDISSPLPIKKSFGTLKVPADGKASAEGGITGPYILRRGGKCSRLTPSGQVENGPSSAESTVSGYSDCCSSCSPCSSSSSVPSVLAKAIAKESINEGHGDFGHGLCPTCAAVNKAFKPDGVTGVEGEKTIHHPPSMLSGVSSRSVSVSEGSSASTALADPPLSQSLISLPFTLHQWWYSWLITYMIMYVGTMNLWLDRVTDDIQVASNFSKIFGMVQVLALVLAPLAGLVMDSQLNSASKFNDPFVRKLKQIQSGFWPMLFTTSTLAAILVCRFFNSTVAVYTSIIFITLLRSFLVAVASAYLRIRFPASHFNKLLGIMSTCGAFVTLLQFPLFIWEAHHVDNALWVNLFNCFCTLIAFLNPIHLMFTGLQRKLISQESNGSVTGSSQVNSKS